MAAKNDDLWKGISGLILIGLGALWWTGFFSPDPNTPKGTDAPAQEVAFIKAITATAARYDDAPNDIAQQPIRRERAKQLCAFGRAVNGWVGEVSEVGSAIFGAHKSAEVGVAISEHVTVRTEDVQGIDDGTLIPVGTALYRTASTLRPGTKVRFSGHFLPDSKDCLLEGSVTESGMMDDPAFIFQFSNITPAK